MAPLSQEGSARILQVRGIRTMVDDPHGIGFREAGPDPMNEGVVGGIEGRGEGDAHSGTLPSGRLWIGLFPLDPARSRPAVSGVEAGRGPRKPTPATVRCNQE